MISYGDLLKKSETSILFLEKISLKNKATNGRFSAYRKLVSKIWDGIQNGGIDEILNCVGKDGEKNLTKSYFALKELYEMVFIFENMEGLFEISDDKQKDEIKKRINFILGGPIYTKDENNDNNQARNYQFELLIASKIFASGIKNVSLEEHPDVLAKVGSLKYGIECKRIFGDFEKQSLKRTNEALNQLSLIKNDIFCGIVALDFSPKYEEGKNLVCGSTKISIEDYVQNSLKNDVSFVYSRNEKLVRMAKNKDIVALFGNVSSVYALNDKSEMGHLTEISALTLSKENPIKSEKFLEDFKNLHHGNIE